MTIGEIIRHRSDADNSFETFSVVNENVNIYGIMKLQGHYINDLKPDVLYVTESDHIPRALPGTEYFNFLIVLPESGKVPEMPDVIRRRSNLLITREDADRIIMLLQGVIFNEQRMERAMRLITEAMFVSGLEKMIEEGARQLHGSLILAEQYGEILQKAAYKPQLENDPDFAFFWQSGDFEEIYEKLENGYYPPVQVTDYMRFPDMKVYRVSYLNKQVVMLPMRINRVVIGKMIGFFDMDREVSVLDAELLHRLNLILGDEIGKEKKVQVNQKQRFLNFMWMLLENSYPNQQAIDSALEDLKITYKGRCCIAVIKVVRKDKDRVTDRDILDVLSVQIDQGMQDVMWVIHNDELVILFNLDEDKDISGHDTRLLRGIAGHNEVSVGISEYRESLIGVRQLYWQAKQAADLGFEFLKSHYTFFSEVPQYAMIRIVQETADPMVFVHPGLQMLLNSKKENYREYFITLYYYLKFNGNTNMAAKATHLHRNTVLYRIDKIQQLLNLNLDDGELTMKLMLSYEILKFLKMFDPEEM